MAKPLATRIRNFLALGSFRFMRYYYNYFYGTDIGVGTRISRKARIDKTNQKGVHIGEYTAITFDSVILTHDYVNNRHRDVYIGSNCFIGCGAVIMPGVTIGDHCIIAPNSLVTRDIPSNSVVVGNPAFVAEKGIETGRYGSRANLQTEPAKAS